MSIELTREIPGAPAHRWKPYPAYKDSGVEWLGKAPKHWEVKKIKRMCFVKRGASPRPIDDPVYFDDEGEYSWVRISDVTASTKYLQTTEQKLSALGKSKSVPLEPGELFLSIAGSVGKPIITAIKCCIHDGFVYFVGLKQNREHMFYLFLSGELYKGLGKLGTQLNLNTDTVGDIKIPVPPLPEQRAIASFLDRQTAHLDALISKKEHLIALLEEKRAALISSVATKGLDPNVPMKDSGVEWLGEIPAHWVLKRLKDVVKINPEALDKNTNPDYILKYVDIGNVSLAGLLNEPEEMRFEVAPSRARRIVRTDDVIVSTVRTYLKAIARFPNPEPNLIVSTGFAVLRPTSLIYSSYLYYTVRSNQFIDAIMAHSEGVGYPAINSSVLAGLPFWLPQFSEQRTIAAFLGSETAKIDNLIVKICDGIEKLREYRTALISAAVTGKIDVRTGGI